MLLTLVKNEIYALFYIYFISFSEDNHEFYMIWLTINPVFENAFVFLAYLIFAGK